MGISVSVQTLTPDGLVDLVDVLLRTFSLYERWHVLGVTCASMVVLLFFVDVAVIMLVVVPIKVLVLLMLMCTVASFFMFVPDCFELILLRSWILFLESFVSFYHL